MSKGEGFRRTRRLQAAFCGALTAVAFLATSSAAFGDPAVSTLAADVASMRWDGTAINADLGENSLGKVGDVNGDGRDDIFMSIDVPANQRGHFILFSPKALGGSPSLATLPPSQGYMILTNGDTTPNAAAVGDQNDDGVPDLLVSTSSSALAVVYSVADPSTLPACPVNTAVRCLDTATLTTDQGYGIVSGLTSDSFGQTFMSAGDADGDDVEDFLISASGTDVVDNNRGAVYVVYGGRTASGTPVNLSTLPASEVLRVDGPNVGASFGIPTSVAAVGDINGDGRDDITAQAVFATANTQYVIYTPAPGTGTMDLSTFGPAQGFQVLPGPLVGDTAAAAGDVNGDGRPDIAFTFAEGAIPFIPGGYVAVVYGPAAAPAAPLDATALGPDQGYVLAAPEPPPAASPGFGIKLDPLGDLNGDAVPDLMASGEFAEPGGVSGAGSIYVVLGKDPVPSTYAVFGPTLTADQGFALEGNADVGDLGTRQAAVGDLDRDGLPDMVFSSPDLPAPGLASGGGVFLILGRSLVGEATTGGASGVSTSGATLGGVGSPNGRESAAYFEYGTGASYGQLTPDQEIGDGGGSQFVDATLTGLDSNTEYHYRLVVENDLGLKRYGADRVVTTNGLPARLRVAVTPSKRSIKTGGRARFTVRVMNTGEVIAAGTRVCVQAPPSLKGGRCKALGSLPGEGSTSRTFTLRATRKARGRLTLRFTASATDVPGQPGTAKLTVRKPRRR